MKTYQSKKVENNIKNVETIKNSLPSYLLESEGYDPYSNKLDEALKENEYLKGKIYQLQYDKQMLIEKNRELSTDLKQLVAQFTKGNSYSKHHQKNHIVNNQSRQPHSNNNQKLQQIVNLKKFTSSLNSQNKLLINMKDSLMKKNEELNRQVQQMRSKNKQLLSQVKDLDTICMNERQKNGIKSQKLMQECEKNLKLQELLKDVGEQLNYINFQDKKKDQDMNEAHAKFHREIQKMKQKTQKYKSKAQQYKNQRDQLNLQIQKAKMQLGTMTLRKYFPDDP